MQRLVIRNNNTFLWLFTQVLIALIFFKDLIIHKFVKEPFLINTRQNILINKKAKKLIHTPIAKKLLL